MRSIQFHGNGTPQPMATPWSSVPGLNPRWQDYLLDTLVTFGVMLDWVPGLVFPGSWMTGTTLLALPAALVSVVLLSWRNQINWHGVLFLMAVLAGLMSFWGTDAYRFYFGRYVINALFLMYFLRRRTLQQQKWLLGTAIVCALAVPVATYLGAAGMIATAGATRGLRTGRMYVGVGASDVGLFIGVIPATLGGACFARIGSRWRWPLIVFGIIVLGSSFYVALATQQRSVLAACVLGMLLSLAGVIRWTAAAKCLALGIIALSLAVGMTMPLSRLERFLPERFSSGEILSDSSRPEGYLLLAEELHRAPTLFGMGFEAAFNQYAMRPHNILGEFYVVGGLILLCSGILFFATLIHVRVRLLCIASTWEPPWDDATTRDQRVLLGVYTSLFVVFLLHSLTHTSLGARPTAMYMGLLMAGFKHLLDDKWQAHPFLCGTNEMETVC